MAELESEQSKSVPVKKSEDFMGWYNEIVERADLADKRYPIKGMNIWRPYGWSIMMRVDGLTRAEMERTGHDEVQFPLLIPEHLFNKEADHIKGFGGEVFWVTHAGHNKLDERWLLRPTSETAMYEIFGLWVRSHADLPLRVFQICNTFRYETKQTRAFMRVREIHFFEDHSCFATYEEAEAHVEEDLAIATNIFKRLGLPVLMSKRPEWDKFAGAHYSVGLDVIMPSGRTLQLGSVHQYRTNFSIPYEITYEKEDGTHEHVHQTTYGMSERVVGAVIGAHGDDRGIVLPPAVAPVQVVVVPIPFKGKEELVLEAAQAVTERLREAGVRVKLDDAEETPGSKYFKWELKGVPLRVEIGPRDIDGGHVMVALRHLEKVKEKVPLGELEGGVIGLLDRVETELMERQQAFAEERTIEIGDIAEGKDKAGVLVGAWCGQDACATEVETTLNVKTLGVPVDSEPDASEDSCVTCGGPAKHWVRWAATY
ncbi:MAG: proline--tRNA ligase [Euryarchaeota archaeon]|nr:proline--tRNA ligase [Euryarchaeota archaeon]